MTSFLLNILVKSLGGSLINAFVIQFVTTRVSYFKPSYLSAYVASFLVLIAAQILAAAGAIANIDRTQFGVPISMLVIFILGSAIYGWLLKHPTDGSIGLLKGVLVSLGQMLLVGALLIGMMLFFYVYRQL